MHKGVVPTCARDCPLLVQVNRETKVGQLEHSVLCEQDVLRLGGATEVVKKGVGEGEVEKEG